MQQKGKLVIFSAPSGSGKTTIVKRLLQENLNLEFSVSATSRTPRGNERNGVDYYFFSTEEFKARIANDEFLEYEEVYSGTYYGTLKNEIERITSSGRNIVFDVDVIGGLNIKKLYGDKALAIFIQPPSIEELKNRLVKRGTDSDEKIDVRISKAEEEIGYAKEFDIIIINEDLEQAIHNTKIALTNFLKLTS